MNNGYGKQWILGFQEQITIIDYQRQSKEMHIFLGEG